MRFPSKRSDVSADCRLAPEPPHGAVIALVVDALSFKLQHHGRPIGGECLALDSSAAGRLWAVVLCGAGCCRIAVLALLRCRGVWRVEAGRGFRERERVRVVAAERRGTARIEFPSELEIVLRREFSAPIQLVFDVLTKAEHMRRTIAPYGEEVTVCSIDLRVGGDYHFVFVTGDGTEMSFRGTYLEVEPPNRCVETWLFEGWPDAEAVESIDLVDVGGGVTQLTHTLAFRDLAGRGRMTKYDGLEANYDNVDDYLRSLLGSGDAGLGALGDRGSG